MRTTTSTGGFRRARTPERRSSPDELVAAINAGSANDVARIIVASEGRTVLNERRTAVQRLNCKGEVTSHIPVPASLIVAAVDAVVSELTDGPLLMEGDEGRYR